MLKHLYCIIIFGVCMACKPMESPQLPSVLVINSKSEINAQPALPRNFRSTLDDLKKDAEGSEPSIQGLKKLNISGSSQFSEGELEFVLDHINHPHNFFIVDLREEWHGFLDGIPVTWYGVRNASNAGKSINLIMREETELLDCLLNEKEIVLSKIVHKDKSGKDLPGVVSMPFTVNSVSNEENLASKYHLGYIRLAVRDALSPNIEMVERFLTFFKNLPEDSWVYFHCAAGRGRTTTFMTMYDILKNAKTVSFDDIINRQALLGGSDLSNLGSETSWKYPFAVKRYQFVKDFYNYVRSNTDDFETSWSEYVTKNNLESNTSFGG